jgi:hypothetical protein
LAYPDRYAGDFLQAGLFLVYFYHLVKRVPSNKFEKIILLCIEEEKMAVPLKTQADLEIARFILKNPTPEQIIAFHPSPEVNERVYELIYADRDGLLTEEEHQELDNYMATERLMRLLKLEARRLLKQQAS